MDQLLSRKSSGIARFEKWGLDPSYMFLFYRNFSEQFIRKGRKNKREGKAIIVNATKIFLQETIKHRQ